VLGDVLNEPHPPITQTSARSVTDAPATQEVAPGPAAPESPAKPAGRTVRIFGRSYPFVAPNIRDPRLHLAAVIISIHFFGQIALGFRVSVPQILVAILVCAVIEVGWTLHKTGTLVWPASAMLTGSGVALILRLSDMRSNDHWTWRGWYVFALVAGLSLLTKYLIRYRGSHIFNPSNVGLVVAFLLLGSTRIEPLDFWWAPFDGWMIAAYLIILVGGLLITARLHLLGMSAAFWLTLAVGIGVLAASGHCMTARWSFEPVCGAHFWWVIVFSPEIAIFLFFMITDPKTSPGGRVARVVFGIGVAMVCTLLIAPQTTEFGAKVALLSGLVVLCVARLVFERFLPAPGSERDRLGAFLPAGGDGDRYVTPGRALGRGAIVGATVVVICATVVAAGAPARESLVAASASVSADPAVRPRLDVHVDPSTLPPVTVDPEVTDRGDLSQADAQAIAVTLAENLEVEAQALRRGEKSLLPSVDDGQRLTTLQGRVDDVIETGGAVVPHYTFDALHVVLIHTEGQSGLSLGFEARGTVEEVTYGVDGAERSRTTSPVAHTFVLSRPTGARWLLVDTQPNT
jgi:Na+-translocating ferredoxin:NAD+ oxidoreductase RnfD subunit